MEEEVKEDPVEDDGKAKEVGGTEEVKVEQIESKLYKEPTDGKKT